MFNQAAVRGAASAGVSAAFPVEARAAKRGTLEEESAVEITPLFRVVVREVEREEAFEAWEARAPAPRPPASTTVGSAGTAKEKVADRPVVVAAAANSRCIWGVLIEKNQSTPGTGRWGVKTPGFRVTATAAARALALETPEDRGFDPKSGFPVGLVASAQFV